MKGTVITPNNRAFADFGVFKYYLSLHPPSYL